MSKFASTRRCPAPSSSPTNQRTELRHYISGVTIEQSAELERIVLCVGLWTEGSHRVRSKRRPLLVARPTREFRPPSSVVRCCADRRPPRPAPERAPQRRPHGVPRHAAKNGRPTFGTLHPISHGYARAHFQLLWMADHGGAWQLSSSDSSSAHPSSSR